MPIQHHFTLLCEHVIVDADGKVSAIGIFRNAALDNVPGVFGMWIVVAFSGAEAGTSYTVSLEGPGRTTLIEGPTNDVPPMVDEQPNKYAQRVTQGVLQVRGLFPKDGIYAVVLKIGGKVIHRERFSVFKKREGQASGG